MLSQRIVFALADDVGKSSANDLMHEVAVMALNNHISLKEAIMNDERVMQYFSEKELDELLNPETYIGLAEEQTQKIIKDIERKRKAT
jgi:adenylosuccinate lyase